MSRVEARGRSDLEPTFPSGAWVQTSPTVARLKGVTVGSARRTGSYDRTICDYLATRISGLKQLELRLIGTGSDLNATILPGPCSGRPESGDSAYER
jgi:hypothetical protein